MAASRLLISVLVLVATTAGAAELHVVHRNSTRPGHQCGIPWSDYQYRPRSPSATAVSRIGILLRTSTRVVDVVEPALPPIRQEYIDEQIRHHLPDGRNESQIERRINQTVQLPEVLPPSQEQRREGLLDPLPAPAEQDDVGLPPNQSSSGLTRRLFTETFTARPPAPEPKRPTVIELYQLDQPRLQIDHCEISQVALQLWENGWWVLSLRADQNRRPPQGEPVVYNPRLHIKRNEFVVRLRCLGAFRTEPTEAALAAGKPVLVDLEAEPFWVENGQPRYVRTGGCCELVQDQFEDIDRVEIEFFYR
jgi:hypothetical protein